MDIDEFFVARLSSKAGRLLFALFVTRELRGVMSTVVLNTDDLVARTGLSRQSVYVALDELIKGGYVSRHDKDAFSLTFALRDTSTPILSSGQIPVPEPAPFSQDPLEMLCYEADKAGEIAKKVEALQAVWDVLFPAEKYPYQRLQIPAAKKFLQIANGSSHSVYTWLKEGVQGQEIQYPKAYSESILLRKARELQEKEQEPVEDGDSEMNFMRELAELGNTYGNNKFKRRFE